MVEPEIDLLLHGPERGDGVVSLIWRSDVDPDDADALARAMHTCLDGETSGALVSAGTTRLQQIEQRRKDAEAALLARLRQFEAKRSCWA